MPEDRVFIDHNGLLFIWNEVKKFVASVLPKKLSELTNDANYVSDAEYVHTDQNYTAAEKDKLTNISAGAQVNTIEIIKVNGKPVDIGADKSIDIKVADEVNLDGLATIEQLSDMSSALSQNIDDVTREMTDMKRTSAENEKNLVHASTVGVAKGVAPLDETGLVPSKYLPSYVDDVVEVNINIAAETPFKADWFIDTKSGKVITPEKGKIYVVVSEGEFLNKEFRWSGTQYTKINDSGLRPMTNNEILAVLETAGV